MMCPGCEAQRCHETERSTATDDMLALAVYVLYGLGYFTGITALIGVIIAHVRVDDADPVQDFLDWTTVSRDRRCAELGADRHPDSSLVVHLVGDPHLQGRPVARRAPADR